MRIPCPLCGERDVQEFTCLGDGSVVRPGPDAGLDAMIDYVHLRRNPAGPHDELFHHASGCRSWLVVTRDTRTHAIHAVRLAREVALARREGAAR